jgi:hypothetical protein
MFTRLLWKEFRALLVLWLALAAGGWAIITAIAATTQFSQAAPLISLAVALGGCFGIAAAAMQFAGEVEDGTAGWLRTLPLDGHSVWSAKLLVNVVGSWALLLVMGVLVWLTSPTLQGQSLESALESSEYFNSERMVRFSLGAPFLAAAVSVRLRGVLAAVLVTSLVAGVFAWLSSWGTNRGEGPAWGVLAIQTTLAIWLSRRWTIAWSASVDFAAPRPAAFVATRATVAHRPWWDLWCERSPVWRMWRSLLWHELRRARVFTLWWMGLAFLAVGLTFVDLANLRLVVLLGSITPSLAGVWSLWGEQRRGGHAFLGDRGVSSSPVWWSKHLVWGLLTILLALPCLLFDAWVEGIPGPVQSALNNYSLSGAPLDRNPLDHRLLTALSNGLPIVAALYAIGHLVSLCSARLVLTLVITFVGAVAWFAWSQSQNIYNGTPIWISAALVTIGALVAAGLLVERWLTRRSLAWGRGLIFATALVGCLLASAGFARARYWSLPSDPLPESLEKELAAMEARMKSPDLDATQAWRKLFDDLTILWMRTIDRPRGPALAGAELADQMEAPVEPAQDPKPWLEWLDRLADAGEQYASGGRRPLLEPHYVRTGGSFSHDFLRLVSDTSCLEKPLNSLREAGEVEREWRLLLGLLRCARVEKSQGLWLNDFRFTDRADNVIFQRILDWASLPAVTPERLDKAITVLREESRGLPPVYERWLARNVLARWYLTGKTYWLRRLVDGNDLTLLMQYSDAPTGLWKARLERALYASWQQPWQEFELIHAMTRYERDLIVSLNGHPRLHELDPHSPKFRSPLALEAGPVRDELLHAPYPLQHFLMAPNRPWEAEQALKRQNHFRLLLAAMKVLHHQKVHGTLPPSLETLDIPIDLFTGRSFEYFPGGLGLPVLRPQGRLLKADQPILRSPGPRGLVWRHKYWTTPQKLDTGEALSEALELPQEQSDDRRSDNPDVPLRWVKPSTLTVLFGLD